MKAMTIPNIATEDGIKVAIFDLSIEDVNERREKRKIAESKGMAVQVLGLASTTRLETIIRNREKISWNGKMVAVRYEYKKYDQPCTTHKRI